MAPAYVPPVSVVLAADKKAYIAGLTEFRHGDVTRWLERFAVATARSKSSTTVAVDRLVDAGVLMPLSEAKRNRAWEAAGLLELLADLEAAR